MLLWTSCETRHDAAVWHGVVVPERRTRRSFDDALMARVPMRDGVIESARRQKHVVHYFQAMGILLCCREVVETNFAQ